MKKILSSSTILSAVFLGFSAPTTFAESKIDCEAQATACYGDCSAIYGDNFEGFLSCVDECDKQKLICLIVKICDKSTKACKLELIRRGMGKK